MCCAAPSVSAASTMRPASSTRCAAASGAFAASSSTARALSKVRSVTGRVRSMLRCICHDTPSASAATTAALPSDRYTSRCVGAPASIAASTRPDRRSPLSVNARPKPTPNRTSPAAMRGSQASCNSSGRAVHERERRHHDAAGERCERRSGAQGLRRHRGIQHTKAGAAEAFRHQQTREGRVRPGCPTTPGQSRCRFRRGGAALRSTRDPPAGCAANPRTGAALR